MSENAKKISRADELNKLHQAVTAQWKDRTIVIEKNGIFQSAEWKGYIRYLLDLIALVVKGYSVVSADKTFAKTIEAGVVNLQEEIASFTRPFIQLNREGILRPSQAHEFASAAKALHEGREAVGGVAVMVQTVATSRLGEHTKTEDLKELAGILQEISEHDYAADVTKHILKASDKPSIARVVEAHILNQAMELGLEVPSVKYDHEKINEAVRQMDMAKTTKEYGMAVKRLRAELSQYVAAIEALEDLRVELNGIDTDYPKARGVVDGALKEYRGRLETVKVRLEVKRGMADEKRQAAIEAVRAFDEKPKAEPMMVFDPTGFGMIEVDHAPGRERESLMDNVAEAELHYHTLNGMLQLVIKAMR